MSGPSSTSSVDSDPPFPGESIAPVEDTAETTPPRRHRPRTAANTIQRTFLEPPFLGGGFWGYMVFPFVVCEVLRQQGSLLSYARRDSNPQSRWLRTRCGTVTPRRLSIGLEGPAPPLERRAPGSARDHHCRAPAARRGRRTRGEAPPRDRTPGRNRTCSNDFGDRCVATTPRRPAI